MKHKIRNIANRAIPVAGNSDLKPEPGQIVEAKMNARLRTQIQNKFFEDLGIIEEKEANEMAGAPLGPEENMPNPHKTKGKKSKKKTF